MTELKCPVCGKQMKIGTLDQDDGLGTVWMSIMPCDCVCSYGASKAVWQELITTRKALDYATEMLTRIAVSPETMLEPEKIVPQLAGLALEQINEHFADTSKKMEQKE